MKKYFITLNAIIVLFAINGLAQEPLKEEKAIGEMLRAKHENINIKKKEIENKLIELEKASIEIKEYETKLAVLEAKDKKIYISGKGLVNQNVTNPADVGFGGGVSYIIDYKRKYYFEFNYINNGVGVVESGSTAIFTNTILIPDNTNNNFRIDWKCYADKKTNFLCIFPCQKLINYWGGYINGGWGYTKWKYTNQESAHYDKSSDVTILSVNFGVIANVFEILVPATTTATADKNHILFDLIGGVTCRFISGDIKYENELRREILGSGERMFLGVEAGIITKINNVIIRPNYIYFFCDRHIRGLSGSNFLLTASLRADLIQLN